MNLCGENVHVWKREMCNLCKHLKKLCRLPKNTKFSPLLTARFKEEEKAHFSVLPWQMEMNQDETRKSIWRQHLAGDGGTGGGVFQSCMLFTHTFRNNFSICALFWCDFCMWRQICFLQLSLTSLLDFGCDHPLKWLTCKEFPDVF